jgi:hypothetical protein
MQVVIQAVDQFGNLLTTDSFSGLLDAPTVTPGGPLLTLEDIAPGQAQLTFLASSLGNYTVGVTLGGTDVQGSRLQVQVVNNLVEDLSRTWTHGSLLSGMLNRPVLQRIT